MLILLFITFLILLITTFIISITNLISKKINEDREKSSPFECGFNPISSSRLPFSSRFFLIAVIFLIFDVEIALILPMTIISYSSSIMTWSLTTTSFIMILIIGTYHEWNQGSLDWAT
nr:NADH dehydrogenase subunit 3 [Carrikerella sp.]